MLSYPPSTRSLRLEFLRMDLLPKRASRHLYNDVQTLERPRGSLGGHGKEEQGAVTYNNKNVLEFRTYKTLLTNELHCDSHHKSTGQWCGNSTVKYPFYCIEGLHSESDFFSPIERVPCRDPDNDFSDDAYVVINVLGPSVYMILDKLTESSYVNDTMTVRVSNLAMSDCRSLKTEKLGWIPTGFHLSHDYTINGTLLDCDKEPPHILNSTFQRVACPQHHCVREGHCFFSHNTLNISGLDLSWVSHCHPYGLIVPKNYNITAMQDDLLQYLLTVGFRITWTKSVQCQSCETSHGICAVNLDSIDDFVCVCANGMHEHNCSEPRIYAVKHSKWRLILGISLGVAFLSITAVMLITIHLWRKLKKCERNNLDLRAYMESIDSRAASVEDFLQGYASGPTRKASQRISGGGQTFGQVETKQFLNEVATIGRIHHIHLVRLLGYCFQKSKRALVYEYMINGSLEKYIHGSQETQPDHVLDWKQLYSIAIGTARGIAYLHEDCANRILHCDIKPHNVLLDANYSPRVADFGLAKLGKREESHMSITAARGTPGYAAPEMWSRNHGPVTDKSNVYGFGMLLLEMVGGRKNMDVGGSRSSQFYFPEWAFKQVEKGEFGKLRMQSEVGGINMQHLAAEDENIAKKLTLIGLTCIHYDSSHRPRWSKSFKCWKEVSK
eukprot:Gb_41449 [translate_table: standard]